MRGLDNTTLWIAAASAAVAFAVSALGFLTLSRRRRPDEGAPPQPAGVDPPLEEALADLRRELDRARTENRRLRRLAAIASTIDLDRVLSRALDAAVERPLADAAMVVCPEDDEGSLVATRGMSAEEADRHVNATGVRGNAARAVEVAYRYDGEDAEPAPHGAGRIRGGLVVPVRGGAGKAIGTLTVFWRSDERRPTDEEMEALEHLAATVGPAIENARRFREARKLADLDALTSLYNRRYFHNTLAREVARAHRYDRRLAVVVFDIDDFKSINERVGHLAGDSVLAELADRIRSVVRSADVACRVGGDEFAVILPESTVADGQQLYRRLQSAIATTSTGDGDHLQISAGVAELAPTDDAVSFFERADDALFRAKDTGKDQSVSADA